MTTTPLLVDEIFNIQNDTQFNEIAIKIFHHQYTHNIIYRNFVNYLFHNDTSRIYQITHYTAIPFMPIEFFKTHSISCFSIQPHTKYFESSGTTKQNLSRHYIYDEHVYQLSILKTFEKFYGHPAQYLFLFLLPSEIERPHSSLIYMAKYLQSFSKYKESGFYLYQFDILKNIIDTYKEDKHTKIFILGLSYALIDMADNHIVLNNNIILMETGGMKGKREEWSKKFFYTYLKEKLGISNIHSEYGMTELFSQAYAQKDGIFYTPPWMKVLVREMDDPLCIYSSNKQGLINIIDLCNIHTCSFIATSDIGKIHNDGSFEILGRSDFSDIRGCNLMYQ